MPLEIERKFLVRTDAWRDQTTHSERLRDGLVARQDGLKVRVRCYGNRTTLCVKSARRGLTRDEFEYEIPADHAEAIFAHCEGRILEKTRHYVPGDSGIWEVDVYHGALEGVVIAEIEVPTETTSVTLPDWVGDEVTSDPRYSKANMLTERSRAATVRELRRARLAGL
ncbi:CYTH domain-containing protein [Bradyrhizobium sp. 83002]|uniref:CYTH domain-containing protein n=1 Tax=Bradyrhizobium aeschynomenes TaxID=2734909 RepID=UPI0015557311|nr:CYTH domain-containing protein [Bradyrhizobium aeschynomenes]NPU10507.1 CYTH domain-containing protein [Bradyrhizobium aeschynomenes]NPV19824.1 CYTH domain-containing protein [Bradyrhizobium aeschynomenes]